MPSKRIRHSGISEQQQGISHQEEEEVEEEEKV